jgi:hypothetical protein
VARKYTVLNVRGTLTSISDDSNGRIKYARILFKISRLTGQPQSGLASNSHGHDALILVVL